jgi:hypothetical protein
MKTAKEMGNPLGVLAGMVALSLLGQNSAIAQDWTNGEARVRELAPGEKLPMSEYKEHLMDMGMVMSPETESAHRRNLESLARAGFIDESSTDPRARFIEQRMAASVASAKLKGSPVTPQTVGFFEMQGAAGAAAVDLPFRPSTLPATYLTANSKSYLLLGGQKLKQFHTSTQFGTLIIDEMNNSTTQLVAPNVKIAGAPATLVYKQHRAGQWATVIYAPRKDKLWIVEADRRLDGKDKEIFLTMVSELVK